MLLPISILLVLLAYLAIMRPRYMNMLDDYARYVLMDVEPPKILMRKMWWIERGAVLLILSFFIATYCYLLYLKNNQ